ncbi:MAG TPA: DUF2905 domain-containing protein [Candidatus Binatia bacterium]|nr:DUF2905 domain-containing protein [Candidatus Binatia bacterium]
MPDLAPIGRTLIVLGVVLIVLGAALVVAPKIPFVGRLPGDIRIERDGLVIYIPLATMLLVSIVLSVLAWLVDRLR